MGAVVEGTVEGLALTRAELMAFADLSMISIEKT